MKTWREKKTEFPDYFCFPVMVDLEVMDLKVSTSNSIYCWSAWLTSHLTEKVDNTIHLFTFLLLLIVTHGSNRRRRQQFSRFKVFRREYWIECGSPHFKIVLLTFIIRHLCNLLAVCLWIEIWYLVIEKIIIDLPRLESLKCKCNTTYNHNYNCLIFWGRGWS